MTSSRTSIALLSLMFAGCPFDQGSDPASHTLPDCAPLLQTLESDIDATQGCQVDSDCAIQMLPCGLVGQCFAPVTTSGEVEINTLLSSLEKDQCAATGSICSCPAIGTATCIGGVCQNEPFDGGPSEVDAGPPTECTSLLAEFDTIVNAPQSCASDSDCSIDLFPCGVVDSCFAAMSNANEAGADSIARQMESEGCGATSGVCSCPAIGFAACISGVCQDSFTPGDGGIDGGPPAADGCGIAGFDGGSCGGLVEQFNSLVTAPQPCSTDDDCVMDVFGCGIIDGCAAAVNPSTQTELSGLLTHLTGDQCIRTSDPCSCPAIGTAVCSAGFCTGSLDQADAGNPTDGGVGAGTCTALTSQIETLTGATQSCRSNSDCAVEPLPCGVGACYAVVTSSTETQVSSLLTQFNADGCSSAETCECPATPATAVCNQGTCQSGF